jgi:hypothetical protein
VAPRRRGRQVGGTYTGQVLRLLGTARLVLVLVVGALLLCTSGGPWVAVVRAVLLWLTADRLLAGGGMAVARVPG